MIFCIWWWAERKASWGGWGLWGWVIGGGEGLGTGVPCPFWWWGLFGDEAVGEEAVVLVVADDEVIEEVDVEDVACLDEFCGYLFVGSARGCRMGGCGRP